MIIVEDIFSQKFYCQGTGKVKFVSGHNFEVLVIIVPYIPLIV